MTKEVEKAEVKKRRGGFFAKVKKTKKCWLWLGTPRRENGYGRVNIYNISLAAHRFSFILHQGNIPKGKLVLHTCDNKLCVNPDHLYLGTNHDNMMDCLRRKRHHKVNQKLCKRGHEFTHISQQGRRTCDECSKILRRRRTIRERRLRNQGQVQK